MNFQSGSRGIAPPFL